MQAGISSYTFTWAIGVPGFIPSWPMSEIDLVNQAEMLGVKVLQIADNLPLHLFDEERLNVLLRHADDKGILIEVGARGLSPDNLETYILLAEKCRSEILRFVIDTELYTPDLPEIVAIILNVLPELKKRSIVLAIENHDRLKAMEFEQIIEQCHSEHVGICLDSVNSLGAGEDVMRISEILAPHTVNFHVKEFMVQRIGHKMGFTVEGVPLGAGMLPLESILNMLDPGKCHSAILEQWTPPSTKLEETIKKEGQWAIESINELKRILDKKQNR